MGYTGSVDLVSGIRPKNNGTFPLVDAKDVRVDDNTRLNTALSNVTTKADGAVRFDTAQSLTDAQKQQARTNIGAGEVDATLSVEGMAADAKKTGDEISALKGDLTAIGSEQSTSIINASDYSFNGTLDNTGVFTPDTTNGHLVTDYIPLEQGVEYTTYNINVNNVEVAPRNVIVYDSSYVFKRTVASNTMRPIIVLRQGEAYIRISTLSAPIKSVLYPVDFGEKTFEFTSDVCDTSLSKSKKAAEAKATGKAIQDAIISFGATKFIYTPVAIQPTVGTVITNANGNANNGNTTNSSGTAYVTISVVEGEVYHITTRASQLYEPVAFFTESPISKSTFFNSPISASAATTYTDAQVTIPHGVTVMGVNTINATTNPISVKKRSVAEFLSNLAEAGFAKERDISYISSLAPVSDRIMLGDSRSKVGYRIDASTGKETTTSTNYVLCDAVSCAVGDVFLLTQARELVSYNASGEFVEIVNVSNIPMYTGSSRYNVWVADYNGFVRITLYNQTAPRAAMTKLSSAPAEIVCLGDSIFGNNQPPCDIPTYIETITNKKTLNCAFGGTEAVYDMNTSSVVYKYNPLSFAGLAEAINSGDWSAVDIDWKTLYGDQVFMPTVYLITHVDWSKVRVITVAFGANDWWHERDLDNESNPLDKTTFKGALRYGIEKILSAYPNITIVLLSPLWQYWSNSQDYSTVDSDTDNRTNDNGIYQMAYVTAMKEVSDEYHMPFFDNYTNGELNKFTGPYMLRDTSHLNYAYGVDRIGRLIGSEVKSVFSKIVDFTNYGTV